jgi:energy-coupling factor transporter ATP-binding protein EcfA2
MKLRKAVIDNFKGIKHLELGFTTPDGGVRDRTLLLGDNGSGKTTALQAIALTFGLATQKFNNKSDFTWPGFVLERMSSLGATSVDLEVDLYGQEWDAIVKLSKLGFFAIDFDKRNSSTSYVSLKYFTEPREKDPQYKYLAVRNRLLKFEKESPQVSRFIARLGDVFWFDQFRSLGASNAAGWTDAVESLRTKLVGLWGLHTSTPPPEKDHVVLIQEHMARIFPGFEFVGVQPKNNKNQPTPTNMYVMVRRDGCEVPYDISEMSSGEQAVFPLAYEIVWQDIANSVVLLDELELHLHPPEQQGLYTFLPKLAPGCQFIVTSHSVALEDIVPEDEKIRLQGGGLCR